MKAAIKRIGILFVMVILVACQKPNYITVPIEISKKGIVESTVIINGKHQNRIQIVFSRKYLSLEKERELVGSGGICPPKNTNCPKGIKIPIKWSLFNKNGKIIATKELDSIEANGWAGEYVYRYIGEFSAKPGEYRFIVETLKNNPEFEKIETHIEISGPNK